jgi:hypothetical protein
MDFQRKTRASEEKEEAMKDAERSIFSQKKEMGGNLAHVVRLHESPR